MFRRRTWLAGALALLGSCSIVQDSCACVLVPPSMHLVGTVAVAGGGQEVVSLATRSHLGACGSTATATLNDQGAQIVSVGAYRLSFQTAEGTHCAILTASTINGQRSRRDSVTMQSSFNADSSRLDLVIP